MLNSFLTSYFRTRHTNFHTENVRPHYAKPLCWRSVHRFSKPLSVCRPSVGLRVRVFFHFRRAGKFFYSIFFRETSTLFLQLWLVCRLVAAAKCVCLCALAFYFADCNILYAPLATIIKTIAPIIRSG